VERTVLHHVCPARAFLLASIVKSALRSAFASTAKFPLLVSNCCQLLIDRSNLSDAKAAVCVGKLELKQRLRSSRISRTNENSGVLNLARIKPVQRELRVTLHRLLCKFWCAGSYFPPKNAASSRSFPLLQFVSSTAIYSNILRISWISFKTRRIWTMAYCC